jgi:amidase
VEIWQLDATETARRVRARELSATEVANSHLDRIERVNPHVNAIVLCTQGEARRSARYTDSHPVGSLAGAAITTKINTDHVPYPTDNGVKSLAGAIATETHPCILGLLEAGGTMMGRTNSPALAMRFHTANDLHGETLNPHNRDASSGGSSGGAGVAVATGMCQIAQGNDVGGSVRWPAAQNGVIGLRPTIGRLPTGGTNPATARSWGAGAMATNGVLARTMRDLRAGYDAMCRPNWNDPLWAPVPLDFPDVEIPRKVALITSDGFDISAEVVDAIRRAGRALEEAGYEVEETTLPMLGQFFEIWEALGAIDILLGLVPLLKEIDDSGLTAALDDWRSSFPPPTGETFMRATLDRDRIMRAWSKFFVNHSAVISPLYAQNSFGRGFDVSEAGAMTKLVHAARWGFNLSAVAMPAMSFPMGKIDGTPLGIQLFSHAWREDQLFAVGSVLEEAFGPVGVVDVAWGN